MKTKIALLAFVIGILIFVIGALCYYSDYEIPLLRLNEFGSSFFDKPSPANWISEDQIFVYKDKIVILIPNATISRYVATKSMDPVIDATSNGLEIPVESVEQIHVGDIIAYQTNGNELIVHRVVKIGIDEQGWYCITKGDNSRQEDGKVRFKQIKFITIGILY